MRYSGLQTTGQVYITKKSHLQITHLKNSKSKTLNKNFPSWNHPVSYVDWSNCFFVLFLGHERFGGALWSFLWTVRPSDFFFHRLLVRRFAFTSFYKLAHLLSLNLAKRKLLAVFRFCVRGAHVIFWTLGVTSATLATKITQFLLVVWFKAD